MVTGQPIADVDVVVLYFGESSEFKKLVSGGLFHHYIPGCGASRITKTDANGQWHVDGFKLGLDAEKLRYSILLYKDGYREGSPGNDPNPTIEMKLTADKDVYEYDSSYPYKKKRDYTQIKNQTIEHYKKWYLNRYYYLGSDILGSDNRHQYLFIGCGEDNAGLNALAEKFMLRWIDPIPERYKQENIHWNSNACDTIERYSIVHPEFRPKLFATESRSEGLRWHCPTVWSSLKEVDGPNGAQKLRELRRTYALD